MVQPGWITTDRNRNLAFPQDGEHRELPSGKWKNVPSVLRDKLESKGVWYFTPHMHDCIELREHGFDKRC
jgi:hypothetical protein